jgi:hypothetical protein
MVMTALNGKVVHKYDVIKDKLKICGQRHDENDYTCKRLILTMHKHASTKKLNITKARTNLEQIYIFLKNQK